MNFWKPAYRFLVDVRNALNVLIAYARARAYPRAAAEAQMTVTGSGQ